MPFRPSKHAATLSSDLDLNGSGKVNGNPSLAGPTANGTPSKSGADAVS